MQAAETWVFLLLFGIVSSNLLPGDKRLGHNHHHHHHQEHHHHQSPPDHQHGGEGEEHHHHHDQHQEPEHDHHHKEDGERSGKTLADIDFSSAVLDDETGLKCVRTDETVETVEREKLLSCTHSSINICHYTYVTQFSPTRVEVCDDVYTKNCNIVFSKQAHNETLEHCYYPMELECGEGEGGEARCQTVWESSCVTRYQSASAQPSPECHKIPVELCGAPACQPRPGARTCHQKVLTNVAEVPEESCDIVPSKICKERFSNYCHFSSKTYTETQRNC